METSGILDTGLNDGRLEVGGDGGDEMNGKQYSSKETCGVMKMCPVGARHLYPF